MKYYYKVSAYNSLGESSLSPYKPWTLLSAPQNVRASLVLSGGDKILNVGWTPVPGANFYHLYYKGGNGTHVAKVTDTSYVETDEIRRRR